MTTGTVLLFFIHFGAAAVTCWYALCALNNCTRATPLATRLGFCGIAIGSFAALLQAPDMDMGGLGAALVFAGLAVGFVADRRRCGCLNCRPQPMIRHTGERHTGLHA